MVPGIFFRSDGLVGHAYLMPSKNVSQKYQSVDIYSHLVGSSIFQAVKSQSDSNESGDMIHQTPNVESLVLRHAVFLLAVFL